MIPLLAMMTAAASGPCTKGTEDTPPLCPLHLPRIAAITIEKNGARAWQEAQGPASCAPFRLNTAQVRRYLAGAKATNVESVDATLARAPCFVSGHLSFSDGHRVGWRIEQYGVGSIGWPTGKTIWVYCKSCTSKPFLQ